MEKINHGGEPTKNIDKKYAIFVGRYQPYHFGHIELIKQKLNQGIPALIMVRNIKPDERNPFTTEQTVTMIKKYHAAHGDDVEVMIIPDIESVNYGRGVGYEINEYQPPSEVEQCLYLQQKLESLLKMVMILGSQWSMNLFIKT